MNASIRNLAVIAVCLLAAVAAWLLAHRSAPAPPPPPVPQIPLATVREGSVERTVAVAGRSGPAAGTQTKLAFAVAGTVHDVMVSLGQHVESGQALAEIDPSSYSLAARQAAADERAAAAAAAGASVDRTTVKLRVDRAELERQRRLFAAGIVALRDVQAAQAAVAADRAESQTSIDQRTAAIEQARSAQAHAAAAGVDLERTVLRAPAVGTVAGIFVQPGDSVDPSVAAIALAPPATGNGTLDVPAAELPRIAVGDLVRVRTGGRAFAARISGVVPAVNPATGLAVVDLRGLPAGLPAGSPLDATIITGSVRGLVVPDGALLEDPQSGATIVFVRTRQPDGSFRFESRPIGVDVRAGGLARVTRGLRAGERVAVQGSIDLLAPAGAGP